MGYLVICMLSEMLYPYVHFVPERTIFALVRAHKLYLVILFITKFFCLFSLSLIRASMDNCFNTQRFNNDLS